MAKETIKERKCLACGKILPKKSRADKKTCNARCRKKYNDCIATVGNTEYKRNEVSKEAKELYKEYEYAIETLQDCAENSLLIDSMDRVDTEYYKAKFTLHNITMLEHVRRQINRLIEAQTNVEISEIQDILDELDDRDNNLFFNNEQ